MSNITTKKLFTSIKKYYIINIKMIISSRFTISVHILICILYFKNEKITSNFISKSVNVNPVIIRNILIQLQKANLITVKRGTGGIFLNKECENITLLEIFNAVDSLDNNKLFNFHKHPNTECPVGKKIKEALNPKLDNIQNTMETELNNITLKDIFNNI